MALRGGKLPYDAEQFAQADAASRQERRGQRFAFLGRELVYASELAVGRRPEHLHCVELRIDEPVLADASPFEQAALDLRIALASALRQHFNYQRRRPLDVLLGHDGRLIARHEQQVGLDHVVVRKDDVEWCEEHTPSVRMRPQIERDLDVKTADELLVPQVRRGSHVVLPVDDLVPLPVVREQHEVVVGEPHVGSCRGCAHRVLPGHGRSLPPAIFPAKASAMPAPIAP